MDAIEKLLNGNKIFLEMGKMTGDFGKERREETATNGQKPYAVVLTCADSRVSPEAVFSVGAGEIFTVRVAGNVATEAVLASIEYAVEHLNVKNVVVLGHTDCGAVAAAKHKRGNSYVELLVDEVRKAVGEETDPIKASMKNARFAAKTIEEKLSLAKFGVTVTPLLYDIRTGKTERI